MSVPDARFSSEPNSAAEKQLAGSENALFDAGEFQRGPRGAMLIAAIAVALLFVGWLLFYFLLFMRRGSVG